MKEEQAKAVELHEEKRAGEKKQVDEEKREEKHEEKERTIGDNGEEKVGETGEIGRAEKGKTRKKIRTKTFFLKAPLIWPPLVSLYHLRKLMILKAVFYWT